MVLNNLDGIFIYNLDRRRQLEPGMIASGLVVVMNGYNGIKWD